MTFTSILAALLAAFVAAPPLGLVAVRSHPERTSNNFWRVRMQPRAASEAAGQCHEGRFAQELIECWLKRTAMALCALALALLASGSGDPVIRALAPVAGLLGGYGLSRTPWFRRESEFVGHMAEAVVARRKGFEITAYLLAEARGMRVSPSYKGLFGKRDAAAIVKAMRRRVRAAKLLLGLHAIGLRRKLP